MEPVYSENLSAAPSCSNCGKGISYETADAASRYNTPVTCPSCGTTYSVTKCTMYFTKTVEG